MFHIKFKDVKPGQKFWIHRDKSTTRTSIKITYLSATDGYGGFVFEDEFQYREYPLGSKVYVDKIEGWKEVNFSELKVGQKFFCVPEDESIPSVKIQVDGKPDYYSYADVPTSVFNYYHNHPKKTVFVKENS